MSALLPLLVGLTWLAGCGVRSPHFLARVDAAFPFCSSQCEYNTLYSSMDVIMCTRCLS